jgi:peptide/nickel transport system substrate-binding protein
MFRQKPRWLVFAAPIAIVATMLLAACGGATSSGQSNVSTNTSVGKYTYTAPTNKGGTVLMSDWQFPDSLNPLFATTVVDYELIDAVWGGPIVNGPNLKWLPDELTEVPTPQNGDVSSNGLTVTLKLRHDLKWSDGQPLTSADYVYGWKTLMDPNTAAASTSGYDQIKSITTPDAYTVVLHYAKPFGPYLLYLPFPLPKHAWSSIPDKNLANTSSVNLTPKVTNGPYMLQSYASGQSFTLVKNPYYKSTTFHGPFLNTLVFKGYGSKDALIEGVKAGETDISEDYNLNDLDKFGGLPGNVQVEVTPSIEYEHLDFNMGSAIFQGSTGLDIRKAIVQSINRCEIINDVLKQSNCSKYLANTVEPPPAIDAANVSPPSYSLSAAKADMQAAGYKQVNGTWVDSSGKPFPTLQFATTSGDTTRADNAQIFAADLKTLGITLKLNFYQAGKLFADYASGGILARGQYDLAEFAYVDSPDPDAEYGIYDSTQIPSASNPSGGNYQRVNNPQVDKDLTLGRYTVDINKRIQYYKDFQKIIIAQQVYTLPLYIRPNITTHNTAVNNFVPSPSSVGNEWNVADWWRSAS